MVLSGGLYSSYFSLYSSYFSLLTHLLYMIPLGFSDMTILRSTLTITLDFFHPHLILALSAFCSPTPELRTFPRFENFAVFSITSSNVTFSSTSVLSAKPEHFLLTKSIYLGQALSFSIFYSPNSYI